MPQVRVLPLDANLGGVTVAMPSLTGLEPGMAATQR